MCRYNRLSVILSVFVLALLLEATSVQAAPKHLSSPMLGGSAVDTSKSSVALILWPTGLCSGLLVGEREVLTAAHCVNSSTPSTEFVVVIGTQGYAVESRWFHGGYVASDNYSLENGRFDIGILLLESAVTAVKPVPVLYDDAVDPGDQALVVGFGSNEVSAQAENPIQNARLGALVVAEKYDGLFSSAFSQSGTAVCSGDSGGPVVQNLAGYYATVGVVSASTTGNEGENCVPTLEDDYSIFVDLQSPYAQDFISYFPGVQRISGKLIFFSVQIGKISPVVLKASSTKKYQRIRERAAALAVYLKQLYPYADATRLPLIKSAFKKLKAAVLARNRAQAAAKIKKAYLITEQLASLGPY